MIRTYTIALDEEDTTTLKALTKENKMHAAIQIAIQTYIIEHQPQK